MTFRRFADLPTCPLCGEADHDWSDGLTFQVEDGSQWPVKCGSCWAVYRVTASIDVTFSTSLEPADE